MLNLDRVTWMTVIFLALATLCLGVVGWSRFNPDLGYSDILYNAVLAFFGAGPYDAIGRYPDDWTLHWARLLGLTVTISAVLGLLASMLLTQCKRIVAGCKWRSQVMIGASEFACDNAARRGALTIFDTAEELAGLSSKHDRAFTIRIPDRMGPEVATGWSLGRRPARVLFGARDAITNVERARVWLATVPERRRAQAEIVLRIEDNTVARDLELLSPGLKNATIISRSETISRSLVTSIAPTMVALDRGQSRVHVVLFGLGAVNLALAEELALRCHHPDLAPPCLTIADRHIDRAKARLRVERPDLLNPEFQDPPGPLVHWLEIDGLECAADDLAQALAERERERPVTAIVVSAGNDATNAGIAMRLRRLQCDQLIMKAPILLRSNAETSIAPRPLTDLTGGVVPFGGRILDAEDIALEEIFDALAQAVHARWLTAPDAPAGPEHKWENLTTTGRRASYRAAMFAVEIFRMAGLVPPVGRHLGDLRVSEPAARCALSDEALIERLADTEHRRWIAERRAEGYVRSPEGRRDHEKKRHPFMVPTEDLPEGQPGKDRQNVVATLKLGIERHRAHPNKPAWRALRRVGIVGPLVATDTMLRDLDRRMEAYLRTGANAEMEFEIVTPNAPGYDRLGAASLMARIESETGRMARLLLLNVARPRLVDRIAAEAISNRSDPTDDLLTDLDRQISQMVARASQVRQMDCRPLGVSDAELYDDRDLYFRTLRSTQNHLIALADIVTIEPGGKDGDWSRTAIDTCRRSGKPML